MYIRVTRGMDGSMPTVMLARGHGNTDVYGQALGVYVPS